MFKNPILKQKNKCLPMMIFLRFKIKRDMKKWIFSVVAIAVLGIGAFFASQNQEKRVLSEIQISNIEALAQEDE